MMTNQTQADRLRGMILSAMETETRRIVDEEAFRAAAAVEKRVRATAGAVATKVASCVSFEPGRDEIRITVHFPKNEKQE